MKEKKVSMGWRNWGILAILIIIIGIFMDLSLQQDKYDLEYEYEQLSQEFLDYTNECKICVEGSVHVCMYPEDYKEIYG